jgi:hypothetical protein
MPEAPSRPEPSLLPIERPRCPKCNVRMHFTRALLGEPGFELRNFECIKCYVFVTKTVTADPLQSEASRWIVSELKPPN